PGSVGGLHAPTNWIRSIRTHCWSLVRQNPPRSTNCRKNAITCCVPYLSVAGKLISSQNTTNHLPTTVGASTIPPGVFLYSQCCSNVFNTSSTLVADEKFNPTTCTSVSLRSAANNVIVLPDPGGPHNSSGRCSANHAYSTLSCRKVSTVGTTTSLSDTRCVSISIIGTLLCHAVHPTLSSLISTS
ncbi:hypothetical protein AX774_g905, partial [Zancudomyces culisetae]